LCLPCRHSRCRSSQVEARLSNGQDPNTYERSTGITALHMAAANGHAEVIRILLKHRAKVNQATVRLLCAPFVVLVCADCSALPVWRFQYDGRTALHFAAQNNAADSIPPLLRADANMRAVSRNGETVKVAAMLAGSEAFLARMKVALAATPRGADAKRRPEKGQVTALQPANPEAHYQELEGAYSPRLVCASRVTSRVPCSRSAGTRWPSFAA